MRRCAGPHRNPARARDRPRCAGRSAPDPARSGAGRARNSPADSGVVALQLPSGTPVFERNPDASLVPASNEKLTSPTRRSSTWGDVPFRTEVLSTGHQDGRVWHGDLYLKGFGDPTLTSLRLARLAAQLKRAGICASTGGSSATNLVRPRRTAPGWKSSFYLFESPPLSALSVDHGVYDGHIALHPALAAAARSGSCCARGASPPGRSGRRSVLWRVRSRPRRVAAPPRGTPGTGSRERQLPGRAPPERARRRGRGRRNDGGRSRCRDPCPRGSRRAARRRTDRRRLGPLARRPDDTARARGAPPAAWSNLELRQSFMRALPVAGVNGTLEHRMERAPARGVVRAKTGTTNRASSLSGFVGNRYVFSILQNGFPVSPWAARGAGPFATALASTL